MKKTWLVMRRGPEIVVEKSIFKLSSWSVSLFHSGSKEPQPNPEVADIPSLSNISYFTQKLVEKLYGGMFSADPRHILLFITEHIMVVRTWDD